MIQYSTSLRNAIIETYETTVGASPKLQIFTGSRPTNCEDADSGTMLVEITLPVDWLSDAADGSVSKLGTWQGTAVASGTAGHFRLKTSGDVCHEQGSIPTDMTIDNASVNSGQTVTVSSYLRTAGNA